MTTEAKTYEAPICTVAARATLEENAAELARYKRLGIDIPENFLRLFDRQNAAARATIAASKARNLRRLDREKTRQKATRAHFDHRAGWKHNAAICG